MVAGAGSAGLSRVVRRIWRTLGARLVAAALLVAAFALRLFRLGETDIWWDEGLAVWAVRPGLREVTAWTAGDVHPPLFFWTLWAWRMLVGETAFALRVGVVLTGVVAVALAGALAWRLGGRRAGWMALALAGGARFAVWWSMELRMYALAGLGVAGAAYALVRWWQAANSGAGARDPDMERARARRGGRWLAGYALCASAVLHTVYLAGTALAMLNLPLLVVAVWRWARGRREAWGLPWAAAQVAVLASFLPWWTYASERMPSWRIVEEGPGFGFVWGLWAALLATGESTEIGRIGVVAATALVLAAILMALWRAARGRDVASEGRTVVLAMLVLLVVGPPLVAWAVTQPRSLFYSPRLEARYFLPFAMPVYAAMGVVLARAGRVGLASWVVAMAVMLAQLPGYFAPRYTTADLPAMSVAIWSQAEPGDVVLLVSGDRYPLFLYHYERAAGDWVGAEAYAWGEEGPRPEVILVPDRGGGDLSHHPGWEARLERIVAEARAGVAGVAGGASPGSGGSGEGVVGRAVAGGAGGGLRLGRAAPLRPGRRPAPTDAAVLALALPGAGGRHRGRARAPAGAALGREGSRGGRHRDGALPAWDAGRGRERVDGRPRGAGPRGRSRKVGWRAATSACGTASTWASARQGGASSCGRRRGRPRGGAWCGGTCRCGSGGLRASWTGAARST